MTPEEKAKELVKKFQSKCSGNSQTILNKTLAKQCASIAVDEIISQLDEMRKPEYTDFWHGDKAGETVDGYFIKEYWHEVKKEIED